MLVLWKKFLNGFVYTSLIQTDVQAPLCCICNFSEGSSRLSILSINEGIINWTDTYVEDLEHKSHVK